MSLLSSFIVNHLVKALEAQFLSHVPEIQQAFLNEVSVFVKTVSDWVESKLSNQGEASNEESKEG
jgi:hypothetical protein